MAEHHRDDLRRLAVLERERGRGRLCASKDPGRPRKCPLLAQHELILYKVE
jgi:hypothetical protein